ncbi:Heterogeneous nuclear ribonucleoprotein H [Oopsacas minuta]|uniref:Heterogeneous nuclear ribonucleoprotein H n=1 Tax=Oopsacas minuta TaxID=111878 RepID=A0AAV7KFT4_9METZ|nr:Heterogeneous nuclear ribonucleoprotein H [Oopsacas minuta]
MNDQIKDEADDLPDDYIIRCRGLPYSATPEDLKKFFSACNITSVFLTQTQDGRPTGEAFLELEDEDSYNSGLKMNKEHIGKRYIEVFESDRLEMDYQIKKSTQGSTAADGVIRMRGLPFNCSRGDIAEFFKDFQLVEDGILLVLQHDGRASGEGYVQLESVHNVEEALKLNNGHIGHRYVELFPSTLDEMQRHSYPHSGGGDGGSYFGSRTFRPTPYDRPGSGPSRGGRGGRREGRGRSGFLGRARGMHRQDYYKGYDESEYDYEYEYEPDYYQNYGQDMGGRMGSGDMVAYPMRGGPPQQKRGHLVRMRGLPFSTTEDEIYQFFYPYVPSAIYIKYDNSGRASGEAEVHFSTHGDAKAVMTKDKQSIGRRYIELFLDSYQESHGSFQTTRGRTAPQTGAFGRSSTMTGAYSLPPPGGYS